MIKMNFFSDSNQMSMKKNIKPFKSFAFPISKLPQIGDGDAENNKLSEFVVKIEVPTIKCDIINEGVDIFKLEITAIDYESDLINDPEILDFNLSAKCFNQTKNVWVRIIDEISTDFFNLQEPRPLKIFVEAVYSNELKQLMIQMSVYDNLIIYITQSLLELIKQISDKEVIIHLTEE